MKVNPIVLVGIPTLQDAPISWEWHDSQKAMQFPLGTAVSHIRVVEKLIADARNIICKQAIAMDADSVLFISDDVIPPTRIFEMLKSILAQDNRPKVAKKYLCLNNSYNNQPVLS